MGMSSSQYYIIGKAVGCFGVDGWLKIQPLTHSPDRFYQIESIFVGTSAEDLELHQLIDVRFRSGVFLAKFRSINDRTAAGKILNKFLFVEEKSIIKPPAGMYFIHDIIGCEVFLTNNTRVGIICDVLQLSAQDIWLVNDADKTYWIPAVKEFIKKVDIKKKRIVIDVVEGLLELRNE